MVDGLLIMLEPHSDEELEFIRYLIKKYIPALRSQGKEMPTVMFEKDFFDENNDRDGTNTEQ